MLLLYPYFSHSLRSLLVIYIPLCFYFIRIGVTVRDSPDSDLHSTMLLLYPGQPADPPVQETIYIPLCFYFIVISLKDCIFLRRFTFHYASTLSSFTNVAIFSFLIYIPLCFYFIQVNHPQTQPPEKNLHSTMLLLYLKK